MEGNPAVCWKKDIISGSANSCVVSSERLGIYNGENSGYTYPVLVLFVDIWHFATGIDYSNHISICGFHFHTSLIFRKMGVCFSSAEIFFVTKS